MKVIEISKGWLRDTVILTATTKEKAIFDTFLGTKLFWVEKGERVRMKLPKSWCVQMDDEISLSDLVLHNQDKFGWCWHF